MITSARLAQVRTMAIAEAASRPPKRAMCSDGDGRLDIRVPLACYLNAKAHEGPEVMSEAGRGYWEDMKRMYPECAVKTEAGRIFVGGAGIRAAGTRNRFGRVRRSFVVRGGIGQWIERE